jgi:probable phosphoglycerate mutase
MSIEFYIFRHGQTEWNRLKRIQGQTNIPLNETGRAEAKSLKSFFKEIDVDVVYSSDLDRAYETAEISFEETGISIIQARELREVYCGEVEGLARAEVLEKYKQTFWSAQEDSEEDVGFSYPGGETRREFRDRLVLFISELSEKTEHSSIAISTHGGALRSLLHSFLPKGTEPIPIPNCVVYKLVFEQEEYKVTGPLNQK